jgi:hypothetical protein
MPAAVMMPVIRKLSTTIRTTHPMINPALVFLSGESVSGVAGENWMTTGVDGKKASSLFSGLNSGGTTTLLPQ